jgi:hypothetical protein
MPGENLERWRELCALAAAEQDPDRLLALVREINTLLERKERRTKNYGRTEPKIKQIKKPSVCTCASRIVVEG